ncbi:deoxyuridine 5'-triphosphate nucleotidohydrolase, mitochondrial-like isoform X1 [Daktulosphaira vitifoliae]|uniref:deoxyuridine 5'-triphosphate nucleotidohydrolase, mitochondrial-like isoform X1 n=1 Tax=Daktulosphaira vitifoliae TaxID=58002 RepID=UPI0021AAED22|nr:deoxyuridine 5'-triphosphate nucleotidohydrolase, mitochondrial-like isoform X1 [Daktulosphaira vitifoliae]
MTSDKRNILAYSKLSINAHSPSKSSMFAAGYDLKSAHTYTVEAHGKKLIKTDLQIKLPLGTYGRIAPRSGLASNNFIDVGAGVIDGDYRGNIAILLFNHSDVPFNINPGDRVAQLICEKITYPELEELMDLDETDRGECGFGSSGIK